MCIAIIHYICECLKDCKFNASKKEKSKYADGPSKEDIGLLEEKGVDGYTFNLAI